MSLEHAQKFVARLREDSQFRWDLGGCKDAFERRRFALRHGYRFSPAELVCATSPSATPSTDRVAVIERARRAMGQSGSAFM